MKKLVAVLLVFFIVMGSVSLMAQDKPTLTLDLKTLKAVNLNAGDKIGDPIPGGALKNTVPFPKNYSDLMILIPAMPNVKWDAFDRVIIKVKYFGEDGKEMKNQKDGMGMVTILYDVNGDIRGGSGEGPGPNNPLKTYNLGGSSSRISTSGGSPLKMDKAPGGILIQNSDAVVKFIELVEVTFFKR
jgi:hypothetical protein